MKLYKDGVVINTKETKKISRYKNKYGYIELKDGKYEDVKKALKSPVKKKKA